MRQPIPTTQGFQTPTDDDARYMEYLDNLVDDLPGGHSFGLLLFKGDPGAFRMGRDEWLTEEEDELESD